MGTYIILSKLAPGAVKDPADIKGLAKAVVEKLRSECPGVVWKSSYATLGRFDLVDVVEAEDQKEVEKAALIIRAYGNATTETMAATPWQEFLGAL